MKRNALMRWPWPAPTRTSVTRSMGGILIMLGFLVQWRTLPTLLMFPLLAGMYVRLARTEEWSMRQEFGEVYDCYAAVTPGFLPTRRWQPHEPEEREKPVAP